MNAGGLQWFEVWHLREGEVLARSRPTTVPADPALVEAVSAAVAPAAG